MIPMSFGNLPVQISGVFLIVVILGSGYVVYRYTTADQQLQKWWRGGEAAPVVCVLAERRIDSSITITMYLKGRLLRSDWEQYDRGLHGHLHAVSHGTTIFSWSDENDTGQVITFTEFTEGSSLTKSDLEGAQCRPWWSLRTSTFASLIGRLGSSTFRLSTSAVSMSLTGSCFSSESAPGPFHHGIQGRGGTIYGAALPLIERQVQASKRTHLIHRPARDIIPPL